MRAGAAKQQIESALNERFGNAFEWRERRPAEVLPTGIAEFDEVLCGFPRGAITEIHGPVSSGLTSVLFSVLAGATSRAETCALIDCHDSFDITLAARAGVALDRLLWVRCSRDLERAFKAVDLLLHSGGFGFLALNLSDVPGKTARRVISSWWFRFRRAIENTPTALLVITPLACVRSSAALALELKLEAGVWPVAVSLPEPPRENNDRSSRLTLVTRQSRARLDSQPSYSQLIEKLRICIQQERPAPWPAGAIRFNAHRH
jgi:hypothetical protein